jgi:hypothetical protein
MDDLVNVPIPVGEIAPHFEKCSAILYKVLNEFILNDEKNV